MDNRQRTAGAMWALLGVVLLFFNSVHRLGARGIDAMRSGLTAGQWVALVVLTVLFVYGEGVRALQRRWVPHMLRRIAALRASDNLLHHLLAPLYALSLIGAPRRTLLYAWAGVIGIVVAVLVISRFPHPWRGITDFAVAAALAWALAVIIARAARTRLR